MFVKSMEVWHKVVEYGWNVGGGKGKKETGKLPNGGLLLLGLQANANPLGKTWWA